MVAKERSKLVTALAAWVRTPGSVPGVLNVASFPAVKPPAFVPVSR